MSISIQIGVDKTYVDDANQLQDVKIGDNKELLSKLRTDISTAQNDIGNKVSTNSRSRNTDKETPIIIT